MIEVHFHAPRFLYRQIRNMIRGLVYVGEGKWTPDEFCNFVAAKDRNALGTIAPAQGLYLKRIHYTREAWSKLKDYI